MRRRNNPGDWLVDAFDTRYDDIYAYLARRVGATVAEDLASEVFAVAHHKQSSFDAAKGSVNGWLFGIATNLIHEHRRSEVRRLKAYTRHGEDPVADNVEASTGVLDRANDRAHIAAALNELSEEHREVLLLAVWAQLTYAELAEALDVPVGTVRSRLSRAKNDMRELLTRKNGGNDNYDSKDITWIS